MKRRKQFYVLSALFLSVGLALPGLAYRLATRPHYYNCPPSYYDIPDGTKVGNVEDTLRRCRQILDTLRANNWDDTKVPDEMLILPDRIYAEEKWHQMPHFPDVSFPSGEAFQKVAFVTDLYFRMNSTWYEGDRVSHAPSGFFIVAWKDGRIEKVPPDKLRMMRVPSPVDPRTTEETVVWPGIAGYRDDLELYVPTGPPPPK